VKEVWYCPRCGKVPELLIAKEVPDSALAVQKLRYRPIASAIITSVYTCNDCGTLVVRRYKQDA